MLRTAAAPVEVRVSEEEEEEVLVAEPLLCVVVVVGGVGESGFAAACANSVSVSAVAGAMVSISISAGSDIVAGRGLCIFTSWIRLRWMRRLFRCGQELLWQSLEIGGSLAETAVVIHPHFIHMQKTCNKSPFAVASCTIYDWFELYFINQYTMTVRCTELGSKYVNTNFTRAFLNSTLPRALTSLLTPDLSIDISCAFPWRGCLTRPLVNTQSPRRLAFRHSEVRKLAD